ncbi:NAD(P)/FAD-dependent oxidoreductase [Lapillicoccus jejuensis]
MVVGGSVAGLAAAVALARSLRSVLVVDAGHPRNAPAEGAHNVLGQEGVAPAELLARGRAEATAYGVTVLPGRATGATRTEEGFAVEVTGDAGRRYDVAGRRLLLATGLVDELPDVPGLREHWGREVVHCPFCHGYEVRGGRIVVLGTSPMAVHQTLMFAALSDDVTLVRDGMPQPEQQDLARLEALGVRLVEGPAVRLDERPGDGLDLVLASGERLPADAVPVQSRVVARSELFAQLGGELVDHPSGMARHVATELGGRTSVPGVFAAGSLAEPMAIVVASMASGVAVGGAVHLDLLLADADARAAGSGPR